jgi:PTS system fructose-specific IIC component
MELTLVNLLPPEHICLDLVADEKNEAIKEMAEMLEGSGKILDKRTFLKCLIAREELETTGIGDGVALPHGRTDAVSQIVMAFARSKKGLKYEALDDRPVHLLFLIAAPRSESTKVLKLLAKVSRLLHNADLRQALLRADTKTDVIEFIKEREQ